MIYKWCFGCHKYIPTEDLMCKCGGVLTFNTFTEEDKERYYRLIKNEFNITDINGRPDDS